MVMELERLERKIILFAATWLSLYKRQQANWCWLYFGITIIQELFSQGTDIKTRLLRKPNWHVQWQQGKWPITKPLSQKEFDIWKEIILAIAEAVATDNRVKQQICNYATIEIPTTARSAAVILDVGMRDRKGSFGVIIAIKGQQTELNSRVVPLTFPMSSYQSELTGLLAGITEVKHQECNHIAVCCDNDAALMKGNVTPIVKNTNLDLRTALAFMMYLLLIKKHYVQGYADATKTLNEMTLWEKANQ